MIVTKKAKELVDKMYSQTPVRKKDKHIKQDYNTAKQCALIAVDEILNNNKILFEDVLNDQYWEEIKQEIELL